MPGHGSFAPSPKAGPTRWPVTTSTPSTTPTSTRSPPALAEVDRDDLSAIRLRG